MKQPLSTKNVFRLMIFIIVALALVAGYYHSVLELYKKKYNRMELQLIKAQAELEKIKNPTAPNQ